MGSKCKPFYHVFFQYLSSPLAKLNTTIGIYPIAYAYNHIKVVESH